MRLVRAAILLAAAGPAWAAGGASSVPPATMTVEVASLRGGSVARRIEARARPGERIVLRDESSVPYPRTSPGGRRETGSVPTGLVTVVTPEIRNGNLVFGFATTVRDVTGFEREPGTPEGSAATVPSVSERTYEATQPSTYVSGTFHGRQDITGTAYGVSVKVRPLAAVKPRR